MKIRAILLLFFVGLTLCRGQISPDTLLTIPGGAADDTCYCHQTERTAGFYYFVDYATIDANDSYLKLGPSPGDMGFVPMKPVGWTADSLLLSKATPTVVVDGTAYYRKLLLKDLPPSYVCYRIWNGSVTSGNYYILKFPIE